MDELSFDTFFTVAVPATIGAGVVVITVVFIFWIGAGKQTSYEDAMKDRQGRAEKALRKQAEKEKEQKQKKEKKRPSEKKRKQEVVKPDSRVEVATTPKLPPAQKSILKTSKPNSVAKPDVSSASRVDFEVPVTPVKNKVVRTNPPTPHPSATRPSMAKALALEEEEDDLFAKQLSAEPKKRSAEDDRPKPKPKMTHSVDVAPPTKTASSSSPRQQKKKKPKQPVDLGSMEALPAARIADIVTASSLSDDDIQQLIDQLLDKMNTNAEWQGGNRGTESVKSLKKANEDLQSRCKEAERTVETHYRKIKDLRIEIDREQNRRKVSESQLQSKITLQSSEITIFKTKISGLEKELKQTKSLSGPHAYQTLQEEYSTLERQLTSATQENSSLTTQVASLKQSLQESQEQASRIRSELHKVKGAAKSPVGDGRVSELEGRLRIVEEESMSLQAALKTTEAEKDRLAEKAQNLPSVTRERDNLFQQLSAAQQQLQDTQATVQTLEQKVADMGAKGTEEEEKLRGEIQQLSAENSRLSSQVESLEEQSAASAMAVQQPEGAPSKEQVEQEVKTRLQAAHSEEQQALEAKMEQERTELQTMYEAKLHNMEEEVKTRLKAAHEEQEALVAKMEVKHTSHVSQLQAQYETELHSIKEELSRVQRAGEEEKMSMKEQLASEATSKQELQSELETLKQASLSTQQNGPVGKEETDTAGGPPAREDQVDRVHHEEVVQAKEEELAKAVEERDELKCTLKSAENKLEELKGKNNGLRDSCWKARDEKAKIEKESEAKLKQLYIEAEKRVKDAEAKVMEEMEAGQRALLHRLFPDVAVETAAFPIWVDQFEGQAQLKIENTKNQLSALTERVEEMEQSEQNYIQETERFRETLNITFSNLAKLQAEVNGESVKHARLLEERDEMLQRERQTNRDMQQQLSKEKETKANLEAELKKVGKRDEEHQERARELEERLKESSQQRETLVQEVDGLNHSLQQETQLRNSAEGKVAELENKCSELGKQLQEALQSSVELGKIGQVLIPDNTEM